MTWANAPSGTHTLTALVTAANGVQTVSAAVPVRVYLRVNTPPEVSVTAPAGGSTYVAHANITPTANASDDRAVGRVDFYSNGTLIGAGTHAGGGQYNLSWDGVPRGSYNLTAVARDHEGATVSPGDGRRARRHGGGRAVQQHGDDGQH